MHWEPVHPSLIPQTIWKEIDDSTVKYNTKHFELNFQVRERKPMSNSKEGGMSKSDKNVSERKEFVPTKRSQQVQIGFKGLGIAKMDDLRKVLLHMDEKALFCCIVYV
ncbi:hypothetical protein RFI_30815 [Reticulomyxa filosa]|uniref:FH2 domain-containing protein n=1 Tax=Reticulomyxa filosa TaxID=46433 RepID=X6LYZ0_RETFI|nr:hypothetical protein RFI_30815 [Reticulomyxa filosa]|eukprot:ETO06576.1 hypothetical protein RFI_30815 [Reticulomyxa filosa]